MSDKLSQVPAEFSSREGSEDLSDFEKKNMEVMEFIKENYGDKVKEVVTEEGDKTLFAVGSNRFNANSDEIYSGLLFCKYGLFEVGADIWGNKSRYIKELESNDAETKRVASAVMRTKKERGPNFGSAMGDIEVVYLDENNDDSVQIACRQYAYGRGPTNGLIRETLGVEQVQGVSEHRELSVQEMVKGL